MKLAAVSVVGLALVCSTLAASVISSKDVIKQEDLEELTNEVEAKLNKWTAVDEDFDEASDKLMTVISITNELLMTKYANESGEVDDNKEEFEEDEDELEVSEEEDDEEDEDDVSSVRGRGGLKGKKGGKHGKKMNGRKGKKMMMKKKPTMFIMKKLLAKSHTRRACVGMEEKVKMLCGNITQAKSHPILAKLYDYWSSKSDKNGGWNTCCSLKDDDAVQSCFKLARVARLDNMCTKKSNECCEIEGEPRYECFTAKKQMRCEENQEDGEESHQRGRGGNRRPGNNYSQCCQAGKNSTDDNETTVEECAENFIDWSEDDSSKNPSCVKGFVSCCLRLSPRKGMAQVKMAMEIIAEDGNIEINLSGRVRPGQNRPGQNRPSQQGRDLKAGMMCCKAGYKQRENATDVDECELGYSSWSDGKENLPTFCADKFVSCCLSEDNARKGSKPWKSGEKKKHHGRGRGKHHKPGKEIEEEDDDEEEKVQRPPKAKGSGRPGKNLGEEKPRGGKRMGKRRHDKTNEIQITDISAIEEEELTAIESELVLPDERGQQIVEHMDMPAEPTFELTNMKPGVKDVGNRRNKKVPRKEKLPDGMRRSPSGHKYYVDTVNPDLETRKGRRISRKNADKMVEN